MDQTRWLRSVEHSLLKSGLPAHYVSRSCLELADHVEACRDAGEAPALLQEPPSELSAQLAKSYRRRGVWRRIPPVTLLLLPFPIALLMTFVYYGLCWAVLALLFQPDGDPSEIPLHVVTTMWALFYSGKLAVPLLSGLAARAIARRMARPWGWAAAIFALQCWATALVITTLNLAPTDVDLRVTLEFVWPHLLEPTQLLSGLAIALLGTWVVTSLRFEQQLRTASHRPGM